jgi:hypothetical protein
LLKRKVGVCHILRNGGGGMKSLSTEELETLLLQWFQHMRSEELPINGPMLQEKAATITLRLKIENLKSQMDGWTGLRSAMT